MTTDCSGSAGIAALVLPTTSHKPRKKRHNVVKDTQSTKAWDCRKMIAWHVWYYINTTLKRRFKNYEENCHKYGEQEEPMGIVIGIASFIIGVVFGGTAIVNNYKKKLKAGMKPFIGKTGDVDWMDSEQLH